MNKKINYIYYNVYDDNCICIIKFYLVSKIVLEV